MTTYPINQKPYQRCTVSSVHKYVARLRVGEEWVAVIATESYEMELAGLLIALQSPGHEGRVGSCAVMAL